MIPGSGDQLEDTGDLVLRCGNGSGDSIYFKLCCADETGDTGNAGERFFGRSGEDNGLIRIGVDRSGDVDGLLVCSGSCSCNSDDFTL